MVFFDGHPIESRKDQQMTASEELARVTWLAFVVYVEFLISVTIFVFTLVGVAIGWPVSALFLLALLQLMIAVPGCVYNTQRMPLFLIIYIALQSITGISELIWFITHLVKDGSWPTAASLAILFLIQMISVLVALCCREKTVIHHKKGDLETHLSYPPEATTPVSGKEKLRKEMQQSELTNRSSKRSSRRASSTKTARSKRSQTSSRLDSKELSGSSRKGSIYTRSTQPTDSTPTTNKFVDTGKKRIEEIRKMIADMDAREIKKNFEASKTDSGSEAISSSK